ncbi:class 1b ribonucleoside-diphosphate reductase subunit beta [Brevibacillus brevis X23]|nr:class 1b ribonucleoside-diphosphate reductase subunit beta [Brevibacillus brevis X23]
MKAVNWNRSDDDITLAFWNQNIMQFWTDDEFVPTDDKMTWGDMDVVQKEVYKRVLAGLTLLDTVQGTVGMPKLIDHVDGLQRKAVLAFMGMMENIHAKSYSTIFTTLATTEEVDAAFEWVENNKYLQQKAKIINEYYRGIKSKKDLYMAMVASVYLESYLFYSGFYYPILLAGQRMLTNSGEIIEKIIHDESIHGLYVGILAQEVFNELTPRDKKRVKQEAYDLLEDLYEIETYYTDDLYSPLGIQEDVKKYVRYNANKALQNLGFDAFFPVEDFNPVVLNGIRTETGNHDFFSKKGSGYVKPTNVTKITDQDFEFNFEWDKE